MREYRGRGESRLKGLRRLLGFLGEIPRYTFSCSVGEWNNNVGVVGDELLVEFCKT